MAGWNSSFFRLYGKVISVVLLQLYTEVKNGYFQPNGWSLVTSATGGNLASLPDFGDNYLSATEILPYGIG